MVATFEEISTPLTEEEGTQEALDYLSAKGFSGTSWQPGSVQLLMVQLLGGYVIHRTTTIASEYVKWGLNYLATGEALERYSDSQYDNQKIGGTYTIGQMRFTVDAGEGPYSVGVGEVVVTDGVSTYRNTTGGTLTSAAPVDLLLTSETTGRVAAIANNTSLTLVTTLTGVTVTNPAIAGSGTWMTQVGSDPEADDVLQERNRTKWSTLGNGETVIDRAINLALNSSSTITKVSIDDKNPRGSGTANVYVGGDNVVVGTDDLDAAQEALDKNFFANMTLGSDERVKAYATTAVELTLVGTVYHDSNYTSAQVQAAVEAAIEAFTKTVPIGGFTYASLLANVVLRGDVVQAIENALGVKSAVLTTPAPGSDISLAFSEQLVPPSSYGLTYVAAPANYYNG